MNSTDMLGVAFKEWAVICAALVEGRQTLLLRKGGIAEEQGEFRVEHERFWLFPTYVHQQEAGLRAEWSDLLAKSQETRPLEATVRLSHWVDVTRVLHLSELDAVLRLGPLHGWSEATVRQRFAYRQPGLFVLEVRVQQAPSPHVIPDLPAYQGCKSWVPLAAPLSIAVSKPILTDAEYAHRQASLDALTRNC